MLRRLCFVALLPLLSLSADAGDSATSASVVIGVPAEKVRSRLTAGFIRDGFTVDRENSALLEFSKEREDGRGAFIQALAGAPACAMPRLIVIISTATTEAGTLVNMSEANDVHGSYCIVKRYPITNKKEIAALQSALGELKQKMEREAAAIVAEKANAISAPAAAAAPPPAPGSSCTAAAVGACGTCAITCEVGKSAACSSGTAEGKYCYLQPNCACK